MKTDTIYFAEKDSPALKPDAATYGTETQAKNGAKILPSASPTLKSLIGLSIDKILRIFSLWKPMIQEEVQERNKVTSLSKDVRESTTGFTRTMHPVISKIFTKEELDHMRGTFSVAGMEGQEMPKARSVDIIRTTRSLSLDDIGTTPKKHEPMGGNGFKNEKIVLKRPITTNIQQGVGLQAMHSPCQ